MRTHQYLIVAFALCGFGLAAALADSAGGSQASSKVARTRDDWFAAFKSRNVATTISFYGPNATFSQPSGERIEGIQAIRELYEKVVGAFDSDLVLQSHRLEVSDELAYDSGQYEETLTNRATNQKQHLAPGSPTTLSGPDRAVPI